jgi:hypothetical protein
MPKPLVQISQVVKCNLRVKLVSTPVGQPQGSRQPNGRASVRISSMDFQNGPLLLGNDLSIIFREGIFGAFQTYLSDTTDDAIETLVHSLLVLG